MILRGTMVSLPGAPAVWVSFGAWPMSLLPMSGFGLGRGWGGPPMAPAHFYAPNPTLSSVDSLQEERSP